MHPEEDQILWEVEDEHLREAAFFFETRESILEAPNYTLAELEVGPEQRLIAHVDALVDGGLLVTERVLMSALEDECEDYETLAAATLALLAGGGGREQRVLGVLDRSGVKRALQLSEHPHIDSWMMEGSSAARLEVLAGRQFTPGAWLGEFMTLTDLATVRTAARLARFSRDPTILDLLGPLAQVADPELQRVTIESALCHLLPGAWESAIYWAFRAEQSPFRRDAYIWVALLGDVGIHEHLLERIDDPDALWAGGFCGRIGAIDRCVELLADENLGPLAAEVVCAIAGLSTEDAQFWRDPPVDEEHEAAEALPNLEDDDLEADLVPAPEEALPIPNPETIRAWWGVHRDQFDPSLRYLGGRPLDRGALVTALWNAPMRRRHVLALELAIRTGGQVFVDTRAMCRVQRSQLDALTKVERIDCQRGLPLR